MPTLLAGRARRSTLDAMVRGEVNSPKAPSRGRLVDAVAVALNVRRERQAHEGEAGARLEAIVDIDALSRDEFAIANLRNTGLPYIEPPAMWRAPLGDLILKTPAPLMAARFHIGLANTIVAMTRKLAHREDARGARFDTVALSGGCFQNRILFEEIVRRLEQDNFTVLSHAQVPANDGGVALGQAAIGGACLIDDRMKDRHQGSNQGISVMCLGIPGRIEKIDDVARKLATVDVGGVKRQVNIACIVSDEYPVSSCVGDWVLIDVGFAMSRIDEAVAAETLRILTELGEAQAELEAMRLSATTTTGAAA
jgi:hydrogenase assembly chaperone HypC/HupF